MQDYRQILMDNFQKVRIEGGWEYWSCGEGHDPRRNWKPWHHLERLCRKQGHDDFTTRDILFEHLGRKLECECQVYMMKGSYEGRRSSGNLALILTAGRSGRWIEAELKNRLRFDFRFGFGMLTADDGIAGFSR